MLHSCYYFFFFFNDTATTEIYTLSLHDALPIFIADEGQDIPVGEAIAFIQGEGEEVPERGDGRAQSDEAEEAAGGDRKSTRLNSSHANISYAVFCLKKKKKIG